MIYEFQCIEVLGLNFPTPKLVVVGYQACLFVILMNLDCCAGGQWYPLFW